MEHRAQLASILGHSQPDGLFAQVTERIALAIISGDVPPGELIPNETNVGGDAPVSRGVYREAVKYLSGKGLIEAKPKSGTRASPAAHWNLLDPDVLHWSLHAGSSEKFINDLYELRSFIEPNAARLAALRRSPAQALALREAYERMAAAQPYSAANIAGDLAFHETLLDSCGNHALMCLKSVVMTTLKWAMSIQTGKTALDYASALGDHLRICEAVEQQDGARAQAVMSVLVHDAMLDTLEIFRRRHEREPFRNAAE